MIRILLIIFLWLVFLNAHAWHFRDLWETPDQQAQKLMNAGKYSEAQNLFEDPHWTAAAAMHAKHYKKANDLYQSLRDEESYYNAGNAQAYLGQYQEAIQSYDKALALNPKNEDARFNRKLIEDLLKTQNKQNQDKQNQDKQNQDKQNQDKQNQDKQNQDKQNQDKQNQDKQNQDKQNQDKQNQDKQNQDKQNQDKQNQDKQNQDKQNQDKQNQDKQNQDKQNQDKQNQDKQNQDKQNQDKQNQDKQDEANKLTPESASKTEEQRAKEQWLQLIPDDPGGLMREKFRRDYLKRQHGVSQ